jgi:Spy/CpxP family protein refolding chaperone
MKTTLLFLVAFAFVFAPLFAQEKKTDAGKVDEAIKTEFDAARKKLEEAKGEYDKANEKMKAARGDSAEAPKRPDMNNLMGLAEMLKQQLALKDDQAAKVKSLAQAGQKELDAGMEAMKATIEALEAERAKESPDLAKTKDLMTRRSAAMAAGEFVRFKFIIDIKPILTPEQAKKWLELRKKMEERMKGAGRPGGQGGAPGQGGEGRPQKKEGKAGGG